MKASDRVKSYWELAGRLFTGDLNAGELAAEVRRMEAPLFEYGEYNGAGLREDGPGRQAAAKAPGRAAPR